MSDAPLTLLLQRWSQGDGDALERLSREVYDTLKHMALRRVRSAQATINPTALVHEAFARLLEAQPSLRNRAHFYALAALHMRAVLVDQARRRSAEKRGGATVHVELGLAAQQGEAEPLAEILAIDGALDKLKAVDGRAARAVELAGFGGLTLEEIAEVLHVSTRTVERDLRFGRAFVRKELAAC